MATLLYWLWYRVERNQPHIKNNLWLRKELDLNYVWMRTIWWVMDLFIFAFIALQIYSMTL